jgi:tetratricopeptide (TPR) repeat protein
MRWALLMVLLTGAAHAGPVQSGNEAFWKGDHAAANKAWARALEESPRSADLWYNYGCGQAAAGRLGRAIHAFEQALLLQPGHDDAAHNLEQVRDAAVAHALDSAGDERVVVPGEDDAGTGLLTALSPGTLAVGFAACWFLLFAALAGLRRAHQAGLRTGLSFAAVVLALGAFATGGLLVGRAYAVGQVEYGVVVVEKARVRAGPGAQYAAGQALLGGVKVRLRGDDGEWRRASLPDGSEGWLRSTSVKPLLRP